MFERTAEEVRLLPFYLPRHEDKVRQLENYVLSKQDEVKVSKERHADSYVDLKKVVVKNIDKSVQNVFPIRKVISGLDTEAVIAEALRTVCVRGKKQMQEST